MILNFISLFLFSFLFHLFILSIAKLGAFGKNFSKIINTFLIKNPIGFYLIYFLFIFVLLIYTDSHIVYCDDIKFTTYIDDIKVTLNGGVLNSVFQHSGYSGVMVAGIRIASSIVSKHPLSLLPKIGTIGGTGVGFIIAYVVLNPFIDSSLVSSAIEINVNLGNGISTSSNINSNFLTPHINHYFAWFTVESRSPLQIYNNHLFATPRQTSAVIQELNNGCPDWKDLFINSPLESGDNSALYYILHSLTNILNLHFIIIYLLTMMIVIFTIKIVIDKNIDLEFIKGYLFGKYLYIGITKYVSIWRNSINLWIYFILFSVLLFNLASSYGIYQVILAANSIN